MARHAYWVNDEARLNGTHEVHDEDCLQLPRESDRTPLGTHVDCWDALERAKSYYNDVNGCPRCSPTCHRSLDW